MFLVMRMQFKNYGHGHHTRGLVKIREDKKIANTCDPRLATEFL